MSLEPNIVCRWCGSVDLYEDIYYDEAEGVDVRVYCNLCGRRTA